MLPLATLLPFIAASFIVVIVPGITVSGVVSATLARGLAAGLWTEVGAQIARLTMVILVAVALTAVTGAVSAAFDVIKYAGAAYLLWIGWGYLTRRHSLALDRTNGVASPVRQIGSGFLLLWSNPKALIFFGAFLPQFVDPRFPAWPQVLVLGLIEMGAALITDSGYIFVAAFARGALTGRAHRTRQPRRRPHPDRRGCLACLATPSMTQPAARRSGAGRCERRHLADHARSRQREGTWARSSASTPARSTPLPTVIWTLSSAPAGWSITW